MKQLEQMVKNSWDAYLETIEDPSNKITYQGDGAVRSVQDDRSDTSFDVIYNPLRDQRRGLVKKEKNDCDLCTNVLKKHGNLFKYNEYLVAPNGWPINKYHTLLVLDEECPKAARQGNLVHSDLLQMMNYSHESGQHVIYNTFGAAATQKHQHFQGFYYDVPVNKLKTIPLSADGVVHTMPDYPGANFVFSGTDKIAPAMELIARIKNYEPEYTYTLLFNDHKLTVIPRRKAGETAECTGKKIGGLECSMAFVVGNQFKEGKLHKSGKEVFFDLGYEDLKKALKDATGDKKFFASWYKHHPVFSQYNNSIRSQLHEVLRNKDDVGLVVGVKKLVEDVGKHKWYLSQHAGYDVGYEKTLADLQKQQNVAKV